MKDELEIDGIDYIKKELVDDEDDDEDEVEYVEIPDNINLSLNGDILFNDRKQRLRVVNGEYYVQVSTPIGEGYTEKSDGKYTVWKDYSDDFCLVSCSREDLEPGDTAFRRNGNDPFFEKLFWYCKILDKEKQAHISAGRNIIVDNYKWMNWWKVVRKDEVEDDE